MKNKTQRFFKKIKRFFTDKNNKVVKARKMFYGVTFSALAVVAAVAILLVSTGGTESAVKSADYKSAVVTNGSKTSLATVHDLLEGLDKLNYKMSIVEYDTNTEEDLGDFEYTHTVTEGSVVCVLEDKLEKITYKSITKDNKTTYSYESKGSYKPHDNNELIYKMSSRTPSYALHDYFHKGALTGFKYRNRDFAISNSATIDEIYICTDKGSNKIIYCETTIGTHKTIYTFEY